MKENMTDDILPDKLISDYIIFEDYSLKTIAKRCAKLIISEYYKDLCYDNFKFPDFEEMKKWVLEEMCQNFDEKVLPIIESANPNLTDEELDAEAKKIEKIYEKEYEEQLDSTTKAALKELRNMVKAIQKDLKVLKRKYTI